MSESDSGEKTLDASAQRLRQAREDGDVAVSREGSVAGIYLAALLATVLVAGPTMREIGNLLVPLLDQPDISLVGAERGLAAAGQAAVLALALALAPLFGLLIAGALLPYIFQNAVAVSSKRIMPKLSHLSPRSGFKRMFSQRALVEFAKNLTKMITVGVACWIVARPLYTNSIGFVAADFSVLPEILKNSVVAILLVTTLVAIVIAGIDIPYQHWSYRRRVRMSVQEMREETRSNEGDPHVRMRQRRVRRERLMNRMMLEVPTATVIITNPTHFAIALRYERGKDPAPVVVAKGVDLIAQKIRQIAFENQVAIIENPSLARALYKSVEIGEVIPKEYFELAAKIISLVWSRSGQQSSVAKPSL
jgi:flagellar biosynthetic protein FlhB